MQDKIYFTTEQAAAYLQIGERKLYELVANGAIPCSKVTGKWLFPRAALDHWIESGLFRPEGYRSEVPPAILGGSHDLLLEWVVRGSGSGLALLPEGSEAGLERLVRNEVMAAAIHFHGSGPDDEASNITAVLGQSALHDAVLIGFARRSQGLMLASGNPLGIAGLVDALRQKARFGLRQKGAGAQLLLSRLLDENALATTQLICAERPYPTGQDLALGIRAGEIDCGIATEAVAAIHGLAFLPLTWERFDLAMRRRSYFEPGMQAVMAYLRRPETARQAQSFGGYDLTEAGQIRFNR